MKKRILLNSAAALAEQLVAIVYGFVLPRLLLDQFGSEVNGLTQSIKQFLGVIGFLDLGVGQVLRSALYRPLAQKDNQGLSCVMASGSRFYRRLAYILAGYTVLLMGLYPLLVRQQFGFVYTAALIGAMAISLFSQYYFGIANEQLLHADQRGYVIYGLQMVSNLLNLLVCMIMLRAGCSIHMVKLAASLVFLLRPVAMELYIRRLYRVDRKVQYTQEPLRQKWNGMAQHISSTILSGTDTIVLTVFSTLTNVSIYSVYYMIVFSVQSFYHAFTAGIQSAVGSLWAGQNEEAMNRMFVRVEWLLHTTVVFVFSCTGLLIVPFVRVYTAGMSDANYVQPVFALILVLAYGIRCLRTPYNIWILAAGHYKQTQICHITAAALNLGISIAAVVRFGLVGVAVGTLVAMAYQTIWMAAYNVKHLLRRSAGSIIRQFLIDMLMVTAICMLAGRIEMVQISYISWIVMAIKVALTAFGVAMASAVLFNRRELAELCRRMHFLHR